MRIARSIVVSDADRQTLQRWARGRSTPARLVLRAKIVLLAAAGKQNKQIAAELRLNDLPALAFAVPIPPSASWTLPSILDSEPATSSSVVWAAVLINPNF